LNNFLSIFNYIINFFSVSKINFILNELAKYLTSFEGSVEISLLIALIAIVVYWFWFKRQIRPIVACFKDIIKALEAINDAKEFVVKFEDFNRMVLQNKLLSHDWQEFYETLVFPKPSDQQQVIRNVQPSSVYFNEETIIHPRININFYDAFPNYCTGAGILGTFIGLIAGIYLAQIGLRSSVYEEVKQSLGNLLGGASMAFLTSIAGLISSISFSWRERHLSHNLRNMIEHFCSLLDARLELVTQQKLGVEHLEEAKKQTLQLERFNNDLAVSIASALDERISGRVVPAMEKLIESVEMLRQDRGEVNYKILENMVDEFKKTISGAAGTELTSIASTLGTLQKTLEGTVGGIFAAQEEINKNTKQIGASVEQSILTAGQLMHEEINKIMQTGSAHLQNASTGAAEQIQAAGSQMSDTISNALREFDANIRGLTTITTQLTGLMGGCLVPKCALIPGSYRNHRDVL
jgi:hypothetical protein